MAKEIELRDTLENMGAQMAKEVVSKTSDIAGDGCFAEQAQAVGVLLDQASGVGEDQIVGIAQTTEQLCGDGQGFFPNRRH